MLELDLLLLPFFDEMFSMLSEQQQQAYVRLLEQEDPDLLSWFGQKEVPEDEELAALVDLIHTRVQPE